MPVNGLLITLTEDEALAQDVLLAVESRDGIELGERTGRWQPVVVETEGTRESHEVHEWLESLPGAVMVDVVFSSVGDPQDHDVKSEEVRESEGETPHQASEVPEKRK